MNTPAPRRLLPIAALMVAGLAWYLLSDGTPREPRSSASGDATKLAETSSLQAKDDHEHIAMKAPVGNDRPTPAEQHRSEVTERMVSWEEKARRHLATTSALGDTGNETLRRSLHRALDGSIAGEPFAARDSFAVAMPSVDELIRNSTINPTGRSLDEAEAAALRTILGEYGRRLRDAKRDTYLASNLGMIEAVVQGDFVQKPNGSDPDGISARVQREKQREFGNKPGFNIAEIPGANLTHNRLVVLTRDRYPDYFSAVDAEHLLHAEYEVAVRTIFLGRRR